MEVRGINLPPHLEITRKGYSFGKTKDMTLFDSNDMAKDREVNKEEFERLCKVEECALDLIDYMEVSGIVKKGGTNLLMYVRRLRKSILDGHGK